MKTLVIGLGNPILSDDAVGWRIVEEVQRLFRENRPDKMQDVEFDQATLGGISLMERLVGVERAVIVDAIHTQAGVPGAIYRLTLDDLPTLNANAIHDASLKAALELGRNLGADLPTDILIYAIEAVNLLEFGEKLTPAVEASVEPAARAILKELIS